MNVVELVTAGVVLVGTVCLGTVLHELSHGLALRAFGVPHELSWFPGADDGPLAAGVTGRWAAVVPRGDLSDVSPASLRVAAMMPLVLATPFALAAVGVVPNLVASGDPRLQAAAIGWLACALPSPQDFALLWHAADALADRR